MRKNNILLWLSALIVVVSLASCDPLSSVEYNIHNITSDTVTITFYKEIMTSPYQGYTIERNDSVTIHYEQDSSRIAILAPNQHLRVQREWHGLYREEQIVPAWKYIESIKTGETELAPEQWNDEREWHSRTKGGGFAEGESRYFDLWIR